VDMGWGQQQMQPQYTSYNVSPWFQCIRLTCLALPRANDGSAATTAATRGIYASTDGHGGAAASAGGVLASTTIPPAAATTSSYGSTYWLWLQQPLRTRWKYNSTAATTIAATHSSLPSCPGCSATATASSPSSTDPAAGHGEAIPGAEEGRRTALATC
jgi:hypothetical protein